MREVVSSCAFCQEEIASKNVITFLLSGRGEFQTPTYLTPELLFLNTLIFILLPQIKWYLTQELKDEQGLNG